jgi:hypothetical protein
MTSLDDRFFGAIAGGQTISAAANAAGYSRRSVYDRRSADKSFQERWDDAVAVAIERMEAEADRRAIEGTLEPVFYQGVECGQVRRFSDTLLIFRLKALRPEMYRERAAVEHTGKDGRDLIPEPATDPKRVAQVLLGVLHAVRSPRPDETPEAFIAPKGTAEP